MRPPIELQSQAARAGWVRRVEEAGLVWHGAGDVPYWNEGEHLVLTGAAAELLEDAATELHAMCLDACGEIMRRDWWERMAIPEVAIGMVQTSWLAGDFSLYGRFDLAWDGRGAPKLLEYNADTPTSLLEAAVIQWQWLEDNFAGDDQFNSIHEALIERWQGVSAETVHFACAWDMLEDRQTIAYLAETAEQAGKRVVMMDMEEIGFSPAGRLTDLTEQPIEKLFKLYPWEWMAAESFFPHLGPERGRLLEPAWKMMLSNKALMPLLWELNPGHPLLLPAAFSREALCAQGVERWAEKPFFGREGNDVVMLDRGTPTARGVATGEAGPRIYQECGRLFQAGGRHFVWGLWMIGDECRGLSARGDVSAITGNCSQFFPHRLVEGKSDR